MVVGVAAAIVIAVPLARYPAAVPVALLAVAPFRVPVQLGERRGLPAPSALPRHRRRRTRARVPHPARRTTAASAVPARAPARRVRDAGRRPRSCGRGTSAPEASRSRSSSSRSSPGSRPSRAARSRTGFRARCSCTLVALGTLFAAIGIWQAHTRTLFFGRDVEVANAYTSFFRVTSLFKDPSLYGRYLVVPIAVLLVAILVRRGRTIDWVVATGVRRVPLPGPLLLVLAVELRRAVRRHVRRRGRRRRSDGPGSSSSPARSLRRSPPPASPGRRSAVARRRTSRAGARGS